MGEPSSNIGNAHGLFLTQCSRIHLSVFYAKKVTSHCLVQLLYFRGGGTHELLAQRWFCAVAVITLP